MGMVISCLWSGSEKFRQIISTNLAKLSEQDTKNGAPLFCPPNLHLLCCRRINKQGLSSREAGGGCARPRRGEPPSFAR